MVPRALAVAALLAVAGCGGGESGAAPTAEPTAAAPSTTTTETPEPPATPQTPTFANTQALIDAATEAGLPCPDPLLLTPGALGSCGGPGAAALQGGQTASEQQRFADLHRNGGGFSLGRGSLLTGPDWSVSTLPGEIRRLQARLGGTIR